MIVIEQELFLLLYFHQTHYLSNRDYFRHVQQREKHLLCNVFSTTEKTITQLWNVPKP